MSGEVPVDVVDDDLAVRQSLAFLFASDGIPVRLHDSATAFLAGPAQAAGCIVTDVRMPGLDGIALLRRLKARGDGRPVIVMTGHADVPLAVAAMREGAFDFIEKPFDDEVLLAAVRAALDSGRRAAERHAAAAETGRRIAALSERERQVLDELMAGSPNKVIAQALGISPRTVEIYRANVMAKMQAGSLAELVRMALTVRPGG
ncbi:MULTISPECIES: response regulator FixJ [Methylobacterium]|uniref:response regulator FixJ n=1 Tax=Methylobacterium TaxID=407 RepID=UPI00272E6E1C|nr:response regulator FixJ [Methylobacterium sp.]